MGEGICWSVVCTELHEDYVLESRVIHRAVSGDGGVDHFNAVRWRGRDWTEFCTEGAKGCVEDT